MFLVSQTNDTFKCSNSSNNESFAKILVELNASLVWLVFYSNTALPLTHL